MILSRYRLWITLGLAALLMGCAPTGYISASVQSVIGLDVSGNPQTQVPHVRFGFVRSQLYYIPTDKVSVAGSPSGNAKETPRVVSSIQVDSQFFQGLKLEEKFAVGDGVADSMAAQALFLPAGTPVVKPRGTPLSDLQNEVDGLIRQPGNRERARAWILREFPTHASKGDPVGFIYSPPAPQEQNLLKLRDALKAN